MPSQVPLILLFIFLLSLYLAIKTFKSKKAIPETTPQPDLELLYFLIRVPRGNEKQPLSAEQMFASLHGLLRETPEFQEHVSFEIASSEEGISFYVVMPQTIKEFVLGQIYSQYPDAEITQVSDYTSSLPKEGSFLAAGDLAMTKQFFFPIKTFRDFEVDPLAAITGSLSEMHHSGQVWWQVLFKPLPDRWQEAGHDFVAIERGEKKKFEGMTVQLIIEDIIKKFKELGVDVLRGLLFQDPKQEEEKKEEKKEMALSKSETLKLIEGKLTRLGFHCYMRIIASHPEKHLADDYVRRVSAAFRQYAQVNLNSFDYKLAVDAASELELYKKRVLPPETAMILTTDEMASIFHFPNISVETPAINWSPAKHGEPPLNLPISDCTYFGRTTYRDKLIKFGIRDEDRRRHMYLIGKTGTGKSTVFKNMIAQDLNEGRGVGVIDPHGQLIEEILELIPDHRLNDVIIFDPSDDEFPVALNMLEADPDDVGMRNLLASGLLSAFRKNFEYSWGPRLEYLLNNAILTLIAVERTTMLGLVRLLIDKNYRKYIVYQIEDPVLKDFWEREYKEFESNQRMATEAVAPIQNKVGRFLASSTLRNILGQAKSTVRFDDAMNEGKILLVNLAKGRIGEDNANLLGSLIVSRLNFMAMQRVKIPESERKDFNLYVDEFQNFASGDFASILSEARKYRLNLHLTHQYTKQLPEEIMDAIIGNVGTMMVFTLGAPDASDLETEFAPYFTPSDLINLEKHHFFVKLMIDNMTSGPFSGVSLPPPSHSTGNKEKVLAISREKYGKPREEVERYVGRWVSRQFDLGMAKAEERKEEV